MDEKQRTRFFDLYKKAKRCDDCGTPGKGWASTGYGMFICMGCAGWHRSLGTHVSRVIHVKMSVWDKIKTSFITEFLDNLDKGDGILKVRKEGRERRRESPSKTY